MDIPRQGNTPKRNFQWDKKSSDELRSLSGRAVQKKPTAKVLEDEKREKEKEDKKKSNEGEEDIIKKKYYTRGEMIDMLMEFTYLSAMLGNTIVRYDPVLKKFYGVNQDFNFNNASLNEKWILSD